MDLQNSYTDELIDLRMKARQSRNWRLADEIREHLDARHVFIFDGEDGQIVYHKTSGSREDLIRSLKQESRAERIFDSWLFSMNRQAG